jgi:hypothetical protein
MGTAGPLAVDVDVALRPFVADHEDVRRLDVPMDHTALVRVGDGPADRGEEPQPVAQLCGGGGFAAHPLQDVLSSGSPRTSSIVKKERPSPVRPAS